MQLALAARPFRGRMRQRPPVIIYKVRLDPENMFQETFNDPFTSLESILRRLARQILPLIAHRNAGFNPSSTLTLKRYNLLLNVEMLVLFAN